MTIYKHKSEFTIQPEGKPEVRVTIETEGDAESIRETFEQALGAVEHVSRRRKQGWKFGLHRGKARMSDNFDDELGEDFWFREDDIL
jgi:hypothetical protein